MSDFSEFDDFDIIEIPRGGNNGRIEKRNLSDKVPSNWDKMADAASQNFGKILDLAQGYLQIKADIERGKATVEILEKQREIIATEAEAYVLKTRAESNKILDHLDKINVMMTNFFRYNNGQMSSSDFRKCIVAAISLGANVNENSVESQHNFYPKEKGLISDGNS